MKTNKQETNSNNKQYTISLTPEQIKMLCGIVACTTANIDADNDGLFTTRSLKNILHNNFLVSDIKHIIYAFANKD